MRDAEIASGSCVEVAHAQVPVAKTDRRALGPTIRRQAGSRLPRLRLALCGSLLAAGCSAPAPVAVSESELGSTGARISMSARGSWTRLNPEGPWLVSPRFLPGSEQVLAAGRKGAGLFVASRGAGLVVVDSGYRGPVSFARGHGDLCLDGEVLSLGTGVRRLARPGECQVILGDEELGEVLHDGPAGRLIQHPMRGDLRLARPDEQEIVIDRRVPFSVRSSASGDRVAYSVGSMDEPALHVWDPEHGVRSLGRGVHAVFHPDGRHLVYADPSELMRLRGMTTAASSELRAADLETGASWPLTTTPELAEMQPELSPDGRQIVFADWRGGGIYAAELILGVKP